jgi:hypothetical protein
MKSNEYLIAMQKKGAGAHSMDAVAFGRPERRQALSLPLRATPISTA